MENTCKHCGCTGLDDDGGQMHWDDCPELKDDQAEGDRRYDEQRDNETTWLPATTKTPSVSISAPQDVKKTSTVQTVKNVITTSTVPEKDVKSVK